MFDLLPIQFRGLDEGASPKTQPVGTLLRAKNCAMDKARRLGKRRGVDGLARTRSDAGSVTAGKRLIPYPSGAIGVYDGTDVLNRNEALDKWTPIERVTPFSMTSRPLIDSDKSIPASDFVVSGDLLITYFQLADLGAMYVKVENLRTAQVVLQPTLVNLEANQQKPRIVLGATKAFMLWAIPGGVITRSLDLATFALGVRTEVSSAGDAVASAREFDACIGTSGSGEALYVAYGLAAGAARMKVRAYLTATLAALANYTVVGSGTDFNGICIAYCTQADRIALIFNTQTGPATYAIMLTSTTLAVATALTSVGYAWQTSWVFIDEYDDSHVVIGYQGLSSYGLLVDYIVTGKADMATLTVPAATTQGSTRLRRPSKPWSVDGRWYFAATVYIADDGVTLDTLPQSSVVVMEMKFTAGYSATSEYQHDHRATLENLTGYYPSSSSNQVKAAVDADGNVWVSSAYRYREPYNSSDAIGTGWNIHKLTKYGDDHMRVTTLGRGLFACGAVSAWLDGAGAMPYGFQHAPKVLTSTPTAGGTMVAGTYTYVACYAWIDSVGVLHRSLPSPPFTGTTAAANLWLKNYIANTSISSKLQGGRVGNDVANPVMIELYRTPVNGTVHYRLIATALVNDPGVRRTLFDDLLPDSDVQPSGFSPLVSQPVVYTETGELGNIPPPASIACITHRGRIVVLDSFKRGVWFTKDYTEDPRVAPGFNEALYLGFATDKNCFGTLDEKLIVYGESTIDIVYGEGPDATGAGAWQTQAIQTDVGCVNPRSVVAAPPGSLFLSRRGIELLSRDLTVSWVGKAVEDTLALYPDITSGVLVASAHEVRWTCRSEDGTTGVIIAWDYLNLIWFTRSYTDASHTSAASVPFVDAAMIDGTYTLLTAGGQVYVESDEHYLDGSNVGTYVDRDIILADISPAGPMGWSRVKDLHVLGTGVTDHDMSVKFARDYAVAYEQTKSFAATSAPVAVGPLTKCRVTLRNQQCRAVRIQMLDTAPTAGAVGTGQGAIYEGLALRVGTKNGAARTTPAEQG